MLKRILYLLLLLSAITGTPFENMLFGKFCAFRTDSLVARLSDDAVKNGGQWIIGNRLLQHGSLISYLQYFWTIMAIKREICITNQMMRFCGKYFSSTFVLICEELAKKLIDKNRSGFDVKVAIDGTNFYYCAFYLMSQMECIIIYIHCKCFQKLVSNWGSLWNIRWKKITTTRPHILIFQLL